MWGNTEIYQSICLDIFIHIECCTESHGDTQSNNSNYKTHNKKTTRNSKQYMFETSTFQKVYVQPNNAVACLKKKYLYVVGHTACPSSLRNVIWLKRLVSNSIHTIRIRNTYDFYDK